jgi:RNase P/RNase MRP subunit POP5
MKPLKPSHRESKRYLLIKGKDANKKTIEDAILEFIGVLGFAQASPQIVKSDKNKLIMAINRGSLEKIRASFLMSGKQLEIVKVSGGIGKLK